MTKPVCIKVYLMDILKLLRPINLLFLVLIQFLLQYCLIVPLLKAIGQSASLSVWYFCLLVLSTVCIAAAGYAINDYFDVDIDRVNRPDKVIVGVTVSPEKTMQIYWLLNLLGTVAGFIAAWKIGNYKLGFLQLATMGTLWFYATSYKRQLLIGNIVVAVLAALAVLIVGFYEPAIYQTLVYLEVLEKGVARLIMQFLCGYAFCAFLLTLIREIIKDLEDIVGDRLGGCSTLPIVIGERVSKFIVFCLILFVFLFLSYYQWFQWQNAKIISVFWILMTIQIPLLILIYLISQAELPKQYHRASQWIKGIMLMGVLYLLYLNLPLA